MLFTRRKLMRRTPFPPRLGKQRRGPARSPEYLAWIRTLPCAVCRRRPTIFLPIEAAHTHALGPRGLGQKSSDFSAIPLCFWHHRADNDSYHVLGERRFAAAHGLDLLALVERLNAQFVEHCGTNACGSTSPRSISRARHPS